MTLICDQRHIPNVEVRGNSVDNCILIHAMSQATSKTLFCYLKHVLNMANIITGMRIVCGIALLFFPAFSPAFYALYIVAGVTDMIDGTVARKTGSAGEFGSKFDTAADFIFASACLIKLIPALDVPAWLLVWIAAVALIKVINVISGFIVRKEFVAVHTAMNKVTGVLLFILPLTLTVIDLKYSGAVVCAVATFAAIQEGHYVRTERYKNRSDKI